MNLVLGVLLGIGLAAILFAAWRASRAERAVPHLRALTGAAAIALADTRAVLAIDGEGRGQVRPDEARELRTDFADFTRYLFRDGRAYVTLGEELLTSSATCVWSRRASAITCTSRSTRRRRRWARW